MSWVPPLYLRRMAAVGLLLVPAVLLWLVVIDPVLSRYADMEAAFSRSIALVSRYRAVAAERGAVADRLQQARTASQQQLGFIDAPNQSLAVANVQNALRRLVEGNGGAIRSLTVLPVVKDKAYEKIATRIEVQISAERLIEVVHGIENHAAPQLIIEALEARGSDLGASESAPQTNAMLTLRLDVAGYWRTR